MKSPRPDGPDAGRARTPRAGSGLAGSQGAAPELPESGGLTWRSLTESDLEPWMDLISRIQDHDRPRERTTPEDLSLLVGKSWVDLDADSVVGIDASGTFRAWGRTSYRPGSFATITVHLPGGVDPAWRGQGIGRQVLAWQDSRALQNVADLRGAGPEAAQLSALIGCFVEEQVVERIRLVRAAGYDAARWFIEMRKKLPTTQGAAPARVCEIPTARVADRKDTELPEGLTLDRVTPENLEQVRVAHNEAFRGHWGSGAMDPEAWRTQFADHPAFRPDLSFVVADRAVEQPGVVGYVMNAEFVDDWPAQGFTEGYTETLGVLPAWRGKGLAARLLEASARAFAGRGHPYAALDVDADNPSALRLYEGLGYVAAQRSVFYGRQA